MHNPDNICLYCPLDMGEEGARLLEQQPLDARDLDALMRGADSLRLKALMTSENSQVGEMFRQLAKELDDLRVRSVQEESALL